METKYCFFCYCAAVPDSCCSWCRCLAFLLCSSCYILSFLMSATVLWPGNGSNVLVLWWRQYWGRSLGGPGEGHLPLSRSCHCLFVRRRILQIGRSFEAHVVVERRWLIVPGKVYGRSLLLLLLCWLQHVAAKGRGHSCRGSAEASPSMKIYKI